MKTNRLSWGIFFILAAALVIVNQLGFFTYMNLWTLLFTVFLIPNVVIGITRRDFFQFFFSIGFLLLIYRKYWGFFFFPSISSWSIMVAALFLAIGFSSIFKSKHYSHRSGEPHFSAQFSYGDHTENTADEYAEHVNDNHISCSVTLGDSSKYIHSNNLQRAFLSCDLGHLKAFFDNSTPHPNGANIDVKCSLGEIELYIPRTWNVVLDIDSTLSGVTEHGRPVYTDGPVVTISGSVQLGAIEIRYI